MRNRALLLTSLLALAACSESATAPATPGARFDGGMTMGGGLAVPSGEQEGAPMNATTPPCTETERGGMTMGGGLIVGAPCP